MIFFNRGSINQIDLYFVVILAQFSEPRYTVSEGGPAVQICIDMTGGIIGQAGLTINIESIMGGSAEGKRPLDETLRKIQYGPITSLGFINTPLTKGAVGK